MKLGGWVMDVPTRATARVNSVEDLRRVMEAEAKIAIIPSDDVLVLPNLHAVIPPFGTIHIARFSEYKCGLVIPEGETLDEDPEKIVLTKTWEKLAHRFPTELLVWRVPPIWKIHYEPLTGNTHYWVRLRMSLAEDKRGGSRYEKVGRVRKGRVRWETSHIYRG